MRPMTTTTQWACVTERGFPPSTRTSLSHLFFDATALAAFERTMGIISPPLRRGPRVIPVLRRPVERQVHGLRVSSLKRQVYSRVPPVTFDVLKDLMRGLLFFIPSSSLQQKSFDRFERWFGSSIGSERWSELKKERQSFAIVIVLRAFMFRTQKKLVHFLCIASGIHCRRRISRAPFTLIFALEKPDVYAYAASLFTQCQNWLPVYSVTDADVRLPYASSFKSL